VGGQRSPCCNFNSRTQSASKWTSSSPIANKGNRGVKPVSREICKTSRLALSKGTRKRSVTPYSSRGPSGRFSPPSYLTLHLTAGSISLLARYRRAGPPALNPGGDRLPKQLDLLPDTRQFIRCGQARVPLLVPGEQGVVHFLQLAHASTGLVDVRAGVGGGRVSLGQVLVPKFRGLADQLPHQLGQRVEERVELAQIAPPASQAPRLCSCNGLGQPSSSITSVTLARQLA
jgi:hypothetical protein